LASFSLSHLQESHSEPFVVAGTKRRTRFEAQCEGFTIYDGEYSGSGFARSEKFPALQYLKPANFTEYSPRITNPFPAEKFRGADAREISFFGRK
jgi:hypothetical protein